VSTGIPGEREIDHEAAAAAFIDRVREHTIEGLDRVYLFGSTPRGEASGLDSDIDALAVVAEDGDAGTVRDTLGEIAYDVMLAYGPVVEIHVVPADRFDRRVDSGFPFECRVATEGERVV